MGICDLNSDDHLQTRRPFREEERRRAVLCPSPPAVKDETTAPEEGG